MYPGGLWRILGSPIFPPRLDSQYTTTDCPLQILYLSNILATYTAMDDFWYSNIFYLYLVLYAKTFNHF